MLPGRSLPAPLLVLCYALAALAALAVFVEHPGMNCNVRFGDMVYARAPRPYVTRVLLPAVARAVTVATPPALRAPLARWAGRVFGVRSRLSFAREFGCEFLVVVVLLFASLLGFAFALRSLAHCTLDLPPPAADLAPAFALLLLPLTYACVSYIYDFPTLFLFTLGLALIARGRTSAFLCVFALATLSKETSILLLPVWLVRNWRGLPRSRLVLLGLLPIGIWLLLRGLLAFQLRHNPGELIQWHLPANLRLLATPTNYFVFRRVFGVALFPRGLNVAFLAAVPFLVLGWRRAAASLRAAFLLIVPLALLTLLFGQVDELRDYTEAYPAAILLLWTGLWTALAGRRRGLATGRPAQPAPGP